MRVLKETLDHGTGQELDKMGVLLDMMRYAYGPEREEADSSYRKRLSEHKLVVFLLTYCG